MENLLSLNSLVILAFCALFFISIVFALLFFSKFSAFKRQNLRLGEIYSQNLELKAQISLKQNDLNLANKELELIKPRLNVLETQNLANLGKIEQLNAENLAKKFELDRLGREISDLNKNLQIKNSEISNLKELNSNLTNRDNIRRYSSKQQGELGEIAMKYIISNSGLSPDQYKFGEATGQGRGIPDCTIYTAKNERIIVDSKSQYQSFATLRDAYLRNENDEILEEKRKCLWNDLRVQIKNFESKYNEDDVVAKILFVPLDGILFEILEFNRALYNETILKHKIIIASPFSLIYLIRIYGFIINEQYILTNSKEIIREFWKFANGTTDKFNIGVQIFNKVVKLYNNLGEALINYQKSVYNGLKEPLIDKMENLQNRAIFVLEKLDETDEIKANMVPEVGIEPTQGCPY